MPSVVISEIDLIQSAQQGDRDALVAIYERYQTPVYVYIYYRVNEQEIAEDLTSEVFVRMVENISKYQHRGSTILAWFYTIARHLLVDHYRAKGSMIHLPLKEELVADDSVNPTRVFEDCLERDGLNRALMTLTEEQRQVIVLKLLEGRDNVEVAAMLGKNERAIRSLQHRALAALQRVMQKEGEHG
jgi:RNA polymerase sigma-70 factor (ECF subfamily)